MPRRGLISILFQLTLNLQWYVLWTADRMEFVLKAFAVVMMVGLAPCVTKDLVTPAVMITDNARTALVYVHKGGMVDIVLCVSFIPIKHHVTYFIQRFRKCVLFYDIKLLLTA